MALPPPPPPPPNNFWTANLTPTNIQISKKWAKTDFAKFLQVFIKSQNLNISRKQLYIRNFQTTCFKMICNYFKSLDFFEQPFWSHCGVISRKLLIKSRNQNIFKYLKWILLAVKFPFQRYIVCCSKICHSKIISGGRGGAPSHLFLFCKIVYKILSSTCWVLPITGATSQQRIPNLPFFSKYPGYVSFVVFYLSIFPQCRIIDELVGKIVIKMASWTIRSNKFDFHRLKILTTFPVTQLLYLDLFELCYTDLRQYVWVPRQNKIKWIAQLANFLLWPLCCNFRRTNKELYAR